MFESNKKTKISTKKKEYKFVYMTSVWAVLAEDLESRIEMSFLEKNIASFIKDLHVSLFKPLKAATFAQSTFLPLAATRQLCLRLQSSRLLGGVPKMDHLVH
jgi:hypothetical protein